MDQKQDQAELSFEPIYAESRSVPGLLHEISLNPPGCTCDGFRFARSCYHLRTIQDLLQRDGGHGKWLAVSGFHKALRRNDAQTALRLGYFLSFCRGPAWIKRYIKSVCFEETRNLDLMRFLIHTGKKSPWHHHILQFCKARKRWELECAARRGLYGILVRPVYAATFHPESFDSMTIKKAFYAATSAEAFYAAYARYLLDGRARLYFREMSMIMRDIAISSGGLAKEAAESFPIENFYGIKNLIDFVTGLADESGNDYVHLGEAGSDLKPEPTLPNLFQGWLQDLHSGPGRGIYRKSFDQLRNLKPQPKDLDVRWHGNMVGTLYRYAAFAQHGLSYLDCKWEDTDVDDELFRMTWAITAKWIYEKT